MLETTVVQEKLDEIIRQHTYLQDYKHVSFEQFTDEKNVHLYYGALHHMQIALQSVIDVCQHILASMNVKTLNSLHDCVIELQKRGVLSEKTSKALGKAVGMRNILIHDYTDVDEKIVYTAIQENLDDLPEFVAQVHAFLQK